MEDFRHEAVFAHVSFQFCGHLDEYLVSRTRHLALLYFQTRFGKGGHLLRRYESGKLVEERRLSSSGNLFAYYFLYGYHHTRELLRFTRGRREQTTVIFTHPVVAFTMGLLRSLRRVKFAFWVWDFFPPTRLVLRLYEAFKRRTVRRSDLAWGLSPALCRQYDAKMRLVALGMHAHPVTPVAGSGGNILIVGQLRHGQGIEEVLAFLGEHREHSLTLLGAAAEGFERTIAELAAQYGLAGRLEFPNRFVSDSEVADAAAKALCGLALYDPDPGNFTHYADPGKVKAYLELALPVVMTRVSATAALLERYHAGEVIESVEQLGPALARIAAGNAAYREGARQFAAEYEFEPYYDRELVW